MKKNILPTLFLSLALALSILAHADVRLPAILGSHMVLQQNTEVKLWGWSDAGEKIKVNVSWDTTTYATTGTSNAQWSLAVKTPAAGGPHKITISGQNTLVLEDVLIGEVWLCSGQSNMEMNVGWGLTAYAEDVANATSKSIRFFHIPRTSAAYPQDDLKAHWVVCSPEEMKRFSAAGYFFGKKIHENLAVPVGLINASWGGTPAEVWTPAAEVENDTLLSAAAKKLKPSEWWPISPGAAYNGMIHPIVNYSLAGALWYQGESNVGQAATYTSLLTALINAWRRRWQQNFPFYFVQIAPYAGYGNSSSSAFLREAQTRVLALPGTGMIVTTDLVDDINDIHPKLKKEVGFRLANLALANIYGKKGIAYQTPMYKSMRLEKDKIRITFNGADKGLVSKGGTPNGFYIAGEDRNFVPASARIEGNTVVVWSKSVKRPVAVRFAFTNAAQPNLFSSEGLPVNGFRTDDWAVDIVDKTLPVK